jgi:molybdopterin synthase sulfur carrier subunit
MAQAYLPRSLVSLFPGMPGRVQVEAASVCELIDCLDRRWPGARFRLCDAGPVIREHINIFVDGEKSTLSTALGPDSEVHILTAVAGG